ncbi:MAG: translation initiation factor IF-2 [Proteobacteria bacterium]|nr:translation initiation factor IF-2 [Pseudomonadota bacterium]
MSLRVFELAKELSLPTKELIERINNMGMQISGNFSALADEQVTEIKKSLLEPATRIKETVVPSIEGEGVKKVRRRIISAKKAKDGNRIKKSLKVEEKPLEKDLEIEKEVPKEEKKAKAETGKPPRKIVRKKAAAGEPTTEDDVQEATALEPNETLIEEGKRKAGKAVKKPTVAAKKKTKKESVDEKKVEKPRKKAVKKAAEVVDEKDKVETTEKVVEESEVKAVGRVVRKKTVEVEKKGEGKPREIGKKKAKGKEETTDVKKAAEVEKKRTAKKVETVDRTTKEKKAGKPVKGEVKKDLDVDPELAAKFEKKTSKNLVKKEKFKVGKIGAQNDLEGLDTEDKQYAKQIKYAQKKRFSKAARRKEKNRRAKEVKKVKHTFNPRQKDLVVGEFVTVGDLAGLIGIKVPQIIKTLMSLGIMATITQSIDGETALLVAAEHNVELKVEFQSIEDSIEQIEDDEKNLVPRPPVVTIMGHVDHGKTSLLDQIRSTNVIDGEAGGITQHIGAYYVKTSEGEIAFLDTPGHEAFTAMRARGADVTDIVVLVVAADDGPRPQTIEAINHSKAADVEIIVAVNKCDKPDANPERTIQQLMEHGIVSEAFGGDVPMVEVSAKTGDGIPKLMELIQLQAEIMELKADPDRLAQGVVIESRVDKGRGNTATILIQTGSLKVGDNYVVGNEYGRVRAMWNDRGKRIDLALPSVPVEIVGLNGVPRAGDRFNVGQDEKQVRQIATLRNEKEKEKKQTLAQKKTLENLFDSMGKAEKSFLNLIVKTDVEGSLEAMSDALNRLGNEQVAIMIKHGAVGAISRTDVILAATCSGVIIGFNTRPDSAAKKLAQEENVDIRLYSIIYETIDDVKNALEGMLKPIIREEIQGKAEVLEIFNIPKVGIVAGSKVVDGKFLRDSPVRVIRNNVIIHDGRLASLRRFKDPAKEVLTGFECGIGIEAYKDIQVGDEIESYTRLETAAKL